MHHTAMEFVDQQLAKYARANCTIVTNTTGQTIWAPGVFMVEYGAQDVNGTIRDLLPDKGVDYFGIDLAPGVGVDFVGDCRNITADDIGRHADIVVCTNVLEHVQDWGDIVDAAYRLLAPGGWLILQCAGPGFQVHSGRSESLQLEPDEYYGNVDHNDLRVVMEEAGFGTVATQYRTEWPHDTFGWAVK